MAWKYRKRIKIAPGVTINVSRSGVSTTIGTKGASVNIGKNGTYLNTGIPGTGIYDRQRIGGGTNRRSSVTSTQGTPGGGNTSGYDNSGCFWFIGIAMVIMFVIYGVTGKFDLPIYLLGLAITIVLWIFVVALMSSKENSNVSNAESDENHQCMDAGCQTVQYSSTEPVHKGSSGLIPNLGSESIHMLRVVS